MSLKLIARDLYRLQQIVDRLQQRVTDAPVDQRQDIQRQLNRAIAERDQVRRMLDGRLDR